MYVSLHHSEDDNTSRKKIKIIISPFYSIFQDTRAHILPPCIDDCRCFFPDDCPIRYAIWRLSQMSFLHDSTKHDRSCSAFNMFLNIFCTILEKSGMSWYFLTFSDISSWTFPKNPLRIPACGCRSPPGVLRRPSRVAASCRWRTNSEQMGMEDRLPIYKGMSCKVVPP